MERKFRVGDRVRRIKDATHDFPIGSLATVVELNGGYLRIRYDHYAVVCNHYTYKFELVEGAKEKHVFQIGDKVRITAKIEKNGRDTCYWDGGGEMELIMHMGEVHEVSEITGLGRILLKGYRWVFLPECLEHVDVNKNNKKVKKPRIKKIPNVPIRSALWENAKKELGGLCSFAMKQDDNHIKYQIGGPCHAALGYLVTNAHKVKELAYSVRWEIKRHVIRDEHLKAYKKYLKYVISESPFASAFLTKRVSTALRYDILMDVSKSRHQIAGACIALREGTEYGFRAPMFEKFVNKGYSGHTAFIMSYAFNEDNGKYFKTNLGRGHCVLYGGMDILELVSFFQNGYTKDKDEKPFSEEHGNYRVRDFVAKSIHEYDVNSISNWIERNAKFHVEGHGWNQVQYLDEKGLFELADKLEQLIKGA